MARKEKESRTDQINFRFDRELLDRMERYRDRHPLKVTLTAIAQAAVRQWLDQNEPLLPPAAKPKK